MNEGKLNGSFWNSVYNNTYNIDILSRNLSQLKQLVSNNL